MTPDTCQLQQQIHPSSRSGWGLEHVFLGEHKMCLFIHYTMASYSLFWVFYEYLETKMHELQLLNKQVFILNIKDMFEYCT